MKFGLLRKGSKAKAKLFMTLSGVFVGAILLLKRSKEAQSNLQSNHLAENLVCDPRQLALLNHHLEDEFDEKWQEYLTLPLDMHSEFLVEQSVSNAGQIHGTVNTGSCSEILKKLKAKLDPQQDQSQIEFFESVESDLNTQKTRFSEKNHKAFVMRNGDSEGQCAVLENSQQPVFSC